MNDKQYIKNFTSNIFKKVVDKSKADADKQEAKKWASEQKFLIIGMGSLTEEMGTHLKNYQGLQDEENHKFWRSYLFKTSELIFKFFHQSLKYPNTQGAAILRESRISVIEKLEEAEKAGYHTCEYIEKLKTLKL